MFAFMCLFKTLCGKFLVIFERAHNSNLRCKVFNNSQFKKTRAGETGTHSLQKVASTFASQNGCKQSDVEICRQWRSQQRIVSRYIDTAASYTDAKVAVVMPTRSYQIYTRR